MPESKKEMAVRREAQKAYCLRLFSSSPGKLSQKPIVPKRNHLAASILSNFELIGPEGFRTSPIVQCRICRTILTRPKRNYCNLGRHLHTRIHQKMEKMLYSSEQDSGTNEGIDAESD